MKQNLFYVFSLVAALAGCSQSEYSPEDNAPVEIRLGSTTQSVVGTTRAPVQGTNSPTIKAKVLLSGTRSAYTQATDKTNRFFEGTMTFTSGNATSFDNTKQYYPSDGTSVYLCGLYPDTGWEKISDTSTADYTLDGKTDVMAAAQVETSKTDGQGTPDYRTLAFSHLLTNLIIKAKVDASAGAPAADVIQGIWGDITSLSLVKAGDATPNNKVTVSLADGTAATASAFSGGTAVGFYKAAGTALADYTYEDNAFADTAIPATDTTIAYSLIAPIEAKGGSEKDFELLVKTANNTIGITVPLSLSVAGDTQGKYCEVTLTFKGNEIMAKATIADWKEGGSASGSLQ